MANQDAAFGFRAVSKLDGSPLGNLTIPVYLPADYATAVYVGSPVVRMAAGSNDVAVDRIGFNAKKGQVTEVNHAGATGNIDYVITSFMPVADGAMGTAIGAASTVRLAWAIPVKDVIFEIQSSGATFDPLNVNAGADFVGTSGSATTGISSAELNTSFGVDGNCAVIGVSYDPSNSDVDSANVNLYVTIRESNLFAAVATI